jgi:hypothetical protein
MPDDIAELRAAADAMTGPEALPRVDGEPLFAEPWEGRAVALAVETVHRLDLEWDDFRQRLVSEIAAGPERPYYESWLRALEALSADHGLTDTDAVATQRMRAASYRTTEVTHDDLEVFPIAATETGLLAVLSEIFERWWSEIRFGILIEGSVFELRAPSRPRLAILDGYLTIDVGDSHLHLCIGDHRGSPGRPVPSERARRRRCSHAELQRLWVDGAPRSWMFRMFNGDGEQQLTVLLPNPFLDEDQMPTAAPDWSKLELWDTLRRDHLGLEPDPLDRSGEQFVHA